MTRMVAEPIVHGHVSSATSASVGGLAVRVVDRNVGGDTMIADAITDGAGAYSTSYVRGTLGDERKQHADLQVQVLVGDQVVARSAVRYSAGDDEQLDVLIPDGVGLPSEHEALHEAIGRVYQGSLLELREADGRQDITYLANKTGWDARAVAMAVAAARLSGAAAEPADDGADGVPAPLYYALLRAGVAADAGAVHEIDPHAALRVWKEAIDAGVIPQAMAESLRPAAAAFTQAAAAAALDRAARPGSSTMAELLDVSVGDDPNSKQAFATLTIQNAGEKFWSAVTEQLGVQTAHRLQVDGKLGFLTLDNAAVMRRLHDAASGDLDDPAQLARAGFHDPSKWEDLLDGVAIPDAVPGETLDEKRANYAKAAAGQLQQSYPTATLTSMIESGAAKLDAPDGVRAKVVTFLDTHRATFEIGQEPIKRYLERNQLTDELGAAEIDQIGRVQRIYQITPDDTALRGLLAAGIHSAFQVIGHDQRSFVRKYAEQVGGASTCELIYRKARQVNNAITNLALSYAAARSAPALGMGSTSAVVDASPAGAAAPQNAGVLPYPTLESLFGSMDYCGCEECRSILSPAAYLVDLLTFLDVDVPGSANPQAVLLGKRPDIEQLPLTCENTNTPLPYIDIVNEVLEYFVVANPRRHVPETAPTMAGFAGHDTDERITAAELASEPRFVDDDAYTALLAESYPPPLPFHRPLESIRRHLRKLGAPLAEAMTALRADDAVERAAAPASYGWRDILTERLGLSRQQYRLLTDSTVGLAEVYGYSATTPDADIIAELTSFTAFARRSQLGYQDVVDLLTARFVNPDAELIPRLERLGVGFDKIKALKDGTISDADFSARLRPGLNAAEYGGDVLAWLRDDGVYARITGLLTITVPAGADQCDVETLELRYALPDPEANRLTAADLVRLARFVRLWRTLGWRIADVDQALCALWPAADWPIGTGADALTRLHAGMLAVLPRLGYAAQLVERLRLKVPRELASLLTLWVPMDTHGDASLFGRLFLSRSALEHDPAFDDNGYGEVLTDANARLLDHADPIRAAATVTGAEFTAIVTALDYTANTPLGIDELSAVYRRGWLARALRISVAELLALVDVSGIDPFAVPDPPAPGVLALLDLVDLLRSAGLKPADALRVVWDRNITAARGLDDATFGTFLRTLRSTLAAVDSDFAVADDPQGELARSRMALVYDADTVAYFFALLDGTAPFTAHYLAPDAGVPSAVLTAAAGRLSYDDLNRQLVHAGPMQQAERDAIVAVADLPADLVAAVGQLFIDSADAQDAFFAAHPELQAPYTAYVSSAAPLPTKRSALLAQVLPELIRRRKQQQALLAASAAASADATFGPALLDDHAVLHAAGDPTRPAVDDLLAAAEFGATAEFYFRATATTPPDLGPATVATIDYAAAGANPLPAAPGGIPISGRWTGWVEAPQTGTYAVSIDADPGATTRLTLHGDAVALAAQDGTWRNQQPITLPAGILVRFELVVENVTNTVALRWSTVGLATQAVAGRFLYAAAAGDAARAHMQRFLCATALASHGSLSAAEAAYLGARSTVDGQGWLDAVAVGGPAGPPGSTALLAPLTDWCEFAAAKARYSPDDDRLLTVVEDPDATLDDGSSLLAAVTGWDEASTAALLSRFGVAHANLSRPAVLGQMRRAFEIVAAVGLDATTLLAATTNDPTGDTVRTLRSALRARSDAASWLDVLKPINDELRELQRDALVAFTLARLAEDPSTEHIDTLDKLFEYFLMDVGMQSATQTSRIRHALSSVQLFVDRCLLNLEPGIQPSVVNSARWAWMKRYRMWEANRKVFLWPENWLEPELRDDASPIFNDVMGELLQGDITDDAAATALGAYLTRLEEIAKLEPSGIHAVENSPGVQDDIAHVIAHTPGAHRKYFYRARALGSWLPWQQMKLDIEDDPVVPCVWQGRLFAFWLRLVAQSQATPSIPGNGDQTALTSLTRADVGALQPKITMQAVLCYSEYVNGKWQPAKTSDVAQPTTLTTCRADQFVRNRLRLGTSSTLEGGLDVNILGDGFSSYFHLYNTHSAPVRAEDMPVGGGFVVITTLPASRSVDTSARDLVATYERAGLFFGTDLELPRDILTTGYNDRAVTPLQNLDQPWDAPFLYSDSRHAFYVTTTERQVSIGVFDGYGTVGTTVNQLGKIGKVIVATPPKVPDRLGPVEGGNPYAVDRGAVQRLISEDAYIRTGIGTTAPVAIDGQLIGPQGAITGVAAHQ